MAHPSYIYRRRQAKYLKRKFAITRPTQGPRSAIKIGETVRAGADLINPSRYHVTRWTITRSQRNESEWHSATD